MRPRKGEDHCRHIIVKGLGGKAREACWRQRSEQIGCKHGEERGEDMVIERRFGSFKNGEDLEKAMALEVMLRQRFRRAREGEELIANGDHREKVVGRGSWRAKQDCVRDRV